MSNSSDPSATSNLPFTQNTSLLVDRDEGVKVRDGDELRAMEVSQWMNDTIDHGATNTNLGMTVNQGVPLKASFKDMVMGDMSLTNTECSIEDLEVEVTNDDVVIKDGVVPEINFSENACGCEEATHNSSLRLPSREQVAIVYGPWMQAPNKKKRVMQSHKAMGDKLVTRGGGHNSRFEVLNVDDVGSDSVVKLFADQLREVVINAGPSPSTKGKMVGVKGVGSSKGADLGGVNHFISVRDSLDALDNHFPNTSP
ncbi:hypothetical protein V6N13_034634 [Hibiscus sabdariffa]